MTVLNGIEIDAIEYSSSSVKSAILNNDPIDDTLHVVVVVSNPALFARRYILTKQFLHRMKQESNVKVYVVELAYGKQKHYITQPDNPAHLQLRTDIPLWHKENMVNIGVRKLLPAHWKAMAWIDADIEFENTSWAMDTLKILNGHKDIVQVFSHCIDMARDESVMNIFNGFGFQYDKCQTYCKNVKNFWHPGYGWAITRKAYERLGGLYEYAILGSADNVMALSLIRNGLKSIHTESTPEYKESVLAFEKLASTLRLGYVPGMIRHHYHGKKQNRKYGERWMILVDHLYVPQTFLTRDEMGLLLPTPNCPSEMLTKINDYFFERNEDDL
jgi:hypothetical protein